EARARSRLTREISGGLSAPRLFANEGRIQREARLARRARPGGREALRGRCGLARRLGETRDSALASACPSAVRLPQAYGGRATISSTGLRFCSGTTFGTP